MFGLRARWLKRTALALGTSLLSMPLAIAHPTMLFAYSVTVGRLTIYSDRAIDTEHLERVIAGVESKLSKSPINRMDERYNIFVAETAWKRSLLFAPVGDVGGAVYFPFSPSSVFLFGADFSQDRLIARTGYIPQNNRTLSYFIAHEITHLQQGGAVGAFKYVMMPVWIREGYADRIGLGTPSDRDQLDASLKAGRIDPEHWNRFGYYSAFRLVVDELIDRDGWSPERLLSSRMSFEEAQVPR